MGSFQQQNIPSPHMLQPHHQPDRHPHYPESEGNGLAIGALVVGIIALLTALPMLFFFIAGPLALLGLVLGMLGLRAARRGRGSRGLALGGVWTSLIALGLAVIGLILAITLFNTFDDEVKDLNRDVRDYASCIERAGEDQAAQAQCQLQFGTD
jgi:hypothetical protein